LIVGPWTHANTVRFPDGFSAGDYRPASLAPSIPWFDHHLLRVPEDASLTAPVRIFVMGENVWRDEQEWPLNRIEYTPLYLYSNGQANAVFGDGQLSPDPPTVEDASDHFEYDPRSPVPSRGGAMLGPRAGIARQNDLETRRDVLVYSTGPLKERVEVTGPVRAELYVTTDAPNTDFTVKLVDVHPDGAAYNVSDGVLRASYPPSTRFPTKIGVELWPTAMLFLANHQIRVEISSSSFPRYDRNPNTGGVIPAETNTRVAQQRVHHGRSAPSRVILPIIPRND
jgi:putative CocE/NonD family hydrolase